MTDHSPDMSTRNKTTEDYGKKWWDCEKPGKNRKAEYIATIIVNLIWLFIINKVPDWDLKFINDRYMAVLWALNLNVFIQIGGNLIMLIFSLRFVRYLAKMVMEAANFFVMLLLYYIYPFDFSEVAGWFFLDKVIPWLLIIGMVVSAVNVISNCWKLLFRRE